MGTTNFPKQASEPEIKEYTVPTLTRIDNITSLGPFTVSNLKISHPNGKIVGVGASNNSYGSGGDHPNPAACIRDYGEPSYYGPCYVDIAAGTLLVHSSKSSTLNTCFKGKIFYIET